MEILSQPFGPRRLGDVLVQELGSGTWNRVDAAVAFAKMSGVSHVVSALAAFSTANTVRFCIGIDHRGTSSEAVTALASAVGASSELLLVHNRGACTFHPKVYLFTGTHRALAIVGSGNLTAGGLFSNYEMASVVELDLKDATDAQTHRSILETIDQWADVHLPTSKVANAANIAACVAAGLLPTEAEIATETSKKSGGSGGSGRKLAANPFGHVPIPPAPTSPGAPGPSAPPPPVPPTIPPATPVASPEDVPVAAAYGVFLMTLRQTDIGVGQKSTGAGRRSPEIFIPLGASIQHDRGFWGWRHLFTEDSTRPGKYDRSVTVLINGKVEEVTMWYNPGKKDLRLRAEAMRSAGNVDDIMVLEAALPGVGYDYSFTTVSPRHPDFAKYASLCRNPVRNSTKQWGYY